MKILHSDCSFFLADGTAFGKADIGFERNELPQIGEVLSIAEMTEGPMPPEVLNRLNENVKFVVEKNILHELSPNSSEYYFGCYLKDVCVQNRHTAEAIFRDLESIGFDCDVWDE
jgi:hypothetical protein